VKTYKCLIVKESAVYIMNYCPVCSPVAMFVVIVHFFVNK